jgi:hypothetical protein
MQHVIVKQNNVTVILAILETESVVFQTKWIASFVQIYAVKWLNVLHVVVYVVQVLLEMEVSVCQLSLPSLLLVTVAYATFKLFVQMVDVNAAMVASVMVRYVFQIQKTVSIILEFVI